MVNRFSIIIPGAGQGKRFEKNIPKPLLKINNQNTILSYQLNYFTNKYKNADILYIIGYKHNHFLNAKETFSKVRFIKNELFDKTNVAKSIELGLLCNIYDKVLIIYGDIYFKNIDFNSLLKEKHNTLLYDNSLNKDEVGMIINNNFVENFSFGLPNKWCHIISLNKSTIAFLSKILTLNNLDHMYGFELLNILLNNNIAIKALKNTGYIVDIDSPKDLEKAKILHENFMSI